MASYTGNRSIRPETNAKMCGQKSDFLGQSFVIYGKKGRWSMKPMDDLGYCFIDMRILLTIESLESDAIFCCFLIVSM